MKSIKSKLIVFLGVLIGSICIGLGTVSFISSSKALTSNIGKTLPKIAEESASSIEGRIEGQLRTLESIATREDIRDTQKSWENKMPVLLEAVERNKSIMMGIADKDGDVKYTNGKDANVKDRAFFQKVLSGKNDISDPLVSKVDGTIVVVYATPIKSNNEVIGALIEVRDGNKLSELTSHIKFGETGNGFMIRKDGTFIAHSDNALVMNMYNTIEEIQAIYTFDNKKSSKFVEFAYCECNVVCKLTNSILSYALHQLFKFLLWIYLEAAKQNKSGTNVLVRILSNQFK